MSQIITKCTKKIKIIKIFTSYYTDYDLHILDKKKPIYVEIIKYPNNRTFVNLPYKSLEIVYCDDCDLYESIDSNEDVHLIKIIK
jgi:hypothetical protein